MSIRVKDITNIDKELIHLSKEQLIAVKHFIIMELTEGTPIDKVYVTSSLHTIEGNAYNGVGVNITSFERFGEVYITTSPIPYSHQENIDDEPLEKWNMYDLEKYDDADFDKVFESFKPQLGKGKLLTIDKLIEMSISKYPDGDYLVVEHVSTTASGKTIEFDSRVLGTKRLVWIDTSDNNNGELFITLGVVENTLECISLKDLSNMCEIEVYEYKVD